MNDGERFLREAVESVRSALRDRNWLAALTLALVLPDVCGKVAFPSMNGSGPRYQAWCDQWLGQAFTIAGKQWLTSADVYALRCAFCTKVAMTSPDRGAAIASLRSCSFSRRPRAAHT
jgi:hypothetical protein